MKPDGARYEHDFDDKPCTCIFLGTYKEFDLYCAPVDEHRFNSVSVQWDDAEEQWTWAWAAALWPIEDPVYPFYIAHQLAVQRGLTPLTMVECGAWVESNP